MDWIRISMDLELLPDSGSGTQKIQSLIRIWNKSFWIHIGVYRNCARCAMCLYPETYHA